MLILNTKLLLWSLLILLIQSLCLIETLCYLVHLSHLVELRIACHLWLLFKLLHIDLLIKKVRHVLRSELLTLLYWYLRIKLNKILLNLNWLLLSLFLLNIYLMWSCQLSWIFLFYFSFMFRFLLFLIHDL